MKSKNYLNYMMWAITAIYVFFSYINIISSKANIHIIYMAVMLILVVLKLTQKNFKFKFSYIDIVWIIYIIMLYINGIFISKYVTNALEYATYNTVIYIVFLLIKSSKDFDSKGIELFYIFSGIHVFFIILQLIFPTAIMKLNYIILPKSGYETNALTLQNNYYSGITIQPAAAGLFATIFVGMSFMDLITGNGNKKSAVFKLLIGIIALLLTQKRSFLIASLFSMIVIYIFYNPNKNLKKTYKVLKIITTITIVMIVAFITIPETRNIVNRMFKEENVLSGRENMYEPMKEWFAQNKIFGVGIGTADATFGYGGHNIYLQTLAETGVIGFLMLYTCLFGTFIKNIIYSKDIISKINKEESALVLYSLYMQIILFIYGLTGNPIYDYTFFIVFILAMAIPAIIKRRLNNGKES